MAIASDIEGRVLLEFYLNSSGCIQEILPKTYNVDILEREAKRAALDCDCQFPVFQKEGNKLPMALTLPITFRL